MLKYILFVLILISCLAKGQDLPNAPSHTWFVLESSILTVANIEDGRSTINFERYGYVEVNSAFLIGRHPTWKKYTIVYGSIQIGTEVAAWYLEKNHRRWVRLVGHGLMWGSIAGHSYGYFHNNELSHR